MSWKRSNVQIQIRHIYLISEFLASEKPLWEHLSHSTFLVRAERFPPRFQLQHLNLEQLVHIWILLTADGGTSPIIVQTLVGSRPPRAHQFFQPAYAEEIGNHATCESKQFLFLIHSQIGQIGHLSLYFYKLHTQHEDTIDANITNNPSQASCNTLGHHLPDPKTAF